mgnify:CR=1 FL=1
MAGMRCARCQGAVVIDPRAEERYCVICGWVDYGEALATAQVAAVEDFRTAKSRMRRPMINGMTL